VWPVPGYEDANLRGVASLLLVWVRIVHLTSKHEDWSLKEVPECTSASVITFYHTTHLTRVATVLEHGIFHDHLPTLSISLSGRARSNEER
jgi:hypothetical protein